VWRWKSVFQRRGLFSTVNAPALLHGHGIWTVVVVQMLLCHDRISGMWSFLQRLWRLTHVFSLDDDRHSLGRLVVQERRVSLLWGPSRFLSTKFERFSAQLLS
jgi:hypothetical protein